MGLIKTDDELDKIIPVCQTTAFILARLIARTEVGMTGIELDCLAKEFFEEAGVKSAFYGLYGFPAQLCVSVNEQLIHGIPDGRKFEVGDVIRYDIGARYMGYCSDTARTFILGEPRDQRHVDVIAATQRALDAGIAVARDGNTLKDIGAAIEAVAIAGGYGNVVSFHGHGIGQSLHEEPAVMNCKVLAKPIVLRAGQVLCLEPMLTLGSGELVVDPSNKWNIRAVDNSIGAHIEDTILVTTKEPEILTR